jgi:hypothetical protein
MTAADRADELRARRAAFEERRRFGLATRHAAKLAHLAARTAKEEEPAAKPMPTEQFPEPGPDAA